MYNISAVTTALTGLVGFRAHNDPEIEALPSELTESRSGLWLDSAHALITARNLSGAAVQLKISDDDSDTDETPLAELLSRVLGDAAAAVLSALRTRKLLRASANLFMRLTELYEGEGSISDLIQPAGRFVGLRLTTDDYELGLHVQRIGLQFTGPVTVLPIYVLTYSQETPYLSTAVITTASGRMYWVDTNLVLSGAASYVIGYYEDDLPPGVSAVRRSKAIGPVACRGCSPQNDTLSRQWSQYVTSVEAIRIDNPGDIVDVIENQNFGINLAFSVGCDLTSLLISQQMNLAEAIRQQAVVLLLNEMAYSPLITTIEQQVRQNAMFALEKTELPKLEKLLDALDIDLSGLNSRCLPDVSEGKLPRRGTVFNRPR